MSQKSSPIGPRGGSSLAATTRGIKSVTATLAGAWDALVTKRALANYLDAMLPKLLATHLF